MPIVERGEKIAFKDAAERTLQDGQMRRNLRHATTVIRGKREIVVNEIDDWQELREQAKQIKTKALKSLPRLLEQLEENVAKAGGQVHWARDADEASDIVKQLAKQSGAQEVVKIKSMTTEEINLNRVLADEGIQAIETDLAELIIQLGNDESTHIVVPSVHWNRDQIRELFVREFNQPALTNNPPELANAARAYLRRKFLTAKVAVSGANFAVAETGSVGIVESEGNGRMCLTLPETLISVMGIEKVIPTWEELSPILEVLPRSATGERMNPYTSIWSGTRESDGPKNFHLVLLDNGRTDILKDPVARETLHCIRCGACLNICPVYRRTGGQAYQSPYSGPIGAIFSPQIWRNERHFAHLPFASSLCGACADVCPVKIPIPRILTQLRYRMKKQSGQAGFFERFAMGIVTWFFMREQRFAWLLKLAKFGQAPFKRKDKLVSVPLMGAWFEARDLPAVADETFRDWWKKNKL